MNSTLIKFGFPQTLIHEYEHWSVLMRPAQATLGALVLCAKSDGLSLADLPVGAFTQLHQCTNHISRALANFRPYDKINYLALMMVDPHVHFHVLPRYAQPQHFSGHVFIDHGWPGVPDLKAAPELPVAARRAIQGALLDAFSKTV